MPQILFNAIDYGFRWTEPTASDPMGWYEFDPTVAEQAARAARDSKVKELRKQGYMVRCFSLSGQLLSRGGIGSGRPHIEVITKAYGINY